MPGVRMSATSTEIAAVRARGVRVRAHREVDPVRDLRARGPDLVARDHEALAVAARRGAQRGEVGAGLGLGEALAEDEPAGRDLREQPLLELLRGVAEQGVADRLDRQQVARQRQPVVAEALLGGDRGERVPSAPRPGARASAGRSSPRGPSRRSPPASRRRRACPGSGCRARRRARPPVGRRSGPPRQ